MLKRLVAGVSPVSIGVAARVSRARIGELQPTRLPLQKLSIQRVERRRVLHSINEKRTRFLENLVEFFCGHFSN